MKNTKRVRIKFDFFDRAGISAYLEEQAKLGWMLEKIGRGIWKFKSIEPSSPVSDRNTLHTIRI